MLWSPPRPCRSSLSLFQFANVEHVNGVYANVQQNIEMQSLYTKQSKSKIY